MSRIKHYCSISKHGAVWDMWDNGTMSIRDMWKPKQRQIDLNPGNGQEGGKVQEPAAVQCLENCHNMDSDKHCWGSWLQKSEPRRLRLSGKGTKQQDYLWHLAVTSLLHETKRKFAHFSEVWLSAISPSYFLFLSFQVPWAIPLYCLFNAFLHRFKNLWMYSAGQYCWAIVLGVPETLQSLVMKVRTFLSSAMTPGGETQGPCSSRASVQTVFLTFCSSTLWPRNKSHWRSLSLR